MVSKKVHIPEEEPDLPYQVIELVDGGEDYELLLEQTRSMDVCAVDSETTSNFDEKKAPYKDWVQGARAFMSTFCASEDTVFATYDPIITRNILNHIQENNIRQVYQNAKFDLHHFREWADYVPKTLDLTLDDTMHAFRLKFPGTKYGLKVASARYAGKVSADYYQKQVFEWLGAEEVLRAEGSLFQGHLKVPPPNFSDVPKEIMLPYAAHDAWLTLISWYGLKETGIFEDELYQSEVSLVQLLVNVERCGWHIKPDVLNFQIEQAKRNFESALKTWYLIAPEVNWASPTEVATHFYGVLNEPVIFKTEGGFPSSSEAAILKFSRNPKLRDALLDCKHWKKALDTLKNILYYSKDNHVFTSLNPERAITGRFGSDHMNLQNIQAYRKNKPWTHQRECFGPESGFTHIFGDYRQIEMVIFAEYVKDENLSQAIIRGDDLHRFTASRMFGILPEDVTEIQRDLGKKMNFTMIYLAGIAKIAAGLENGEKGEGAVTYEQIEAVLGHPGTHTELAKFMTGKYHSGYPTVRPWIKQVIKDVEGRRPRPYIKNKFGRIVPVGYGYEYKAINYLIQGTAADLMKVAMRRSWSVLEKWTLENNLIPWKDTQLFVTIHDDLGFKIPTGRAEEIIALLEPAMTDFPEFRLPIRVEFATVNSDSSWALKKKMKL